MKKEVMEKLTTLISAAFGFVAALAWNDTIKKIFDSLFGTTETIWAMLIYAVVVTFIAVYVTIKLGKIKAK